MSDFYDVLPLPTHIGNTIDQKTKRIKPFVAVYFPDEILNRMKWDRKTPLVLEVKMHH